MSCEVASPDVIDIGIRIAIYSYAGCSAVLGFLTLVGAGQRRLIQDEDDRERYTELVTKHISDVNYAVETSTLTGVALIMAALWHQHQYHGLTLFHAYIVILLLWVITLTGMWFVIHAWVFDILRRNKRRISTSSFWKQILKKSHWFTIQFSLMGGYGLYVTIRRNDFLSPDCGLPFFKDKVWSSFLFGFSAAPIVNSCMLFIITSSLVWLASVIVVYSRKGWAGQVDPVVFCVFWLLEYVIMLGGLIATIETSITRYTSGGESKSPFGSTLAIALVVVPARLVILRAWQLISHQEDEATSNGEKLPIVSHHKPGGSKGEKFTLVLPHKPAPTSRIRLPSTRSVAPSRPPQGATKRNHKPPPYRHREFKALVVTQ